MFEKLIGRIGEAGISWTKVGLIVMAAGLTIQQVAHPAFAWNAEGIGEILAIWGIGGAGIGAKNHLERVASFGRDQP